LQHRLRDVQTGNAEARLGQGERHPSRTAAKLQHGELALGVHACRELDEEVEVGVVAAIFEIVIVRKEAVALGGHAVSSTLSFARACHTSSASRALRSRVAP